MKMIRVVAAVLVCLATVQVADAQSRKRTKVRFNAPVEIPNPNTKAGVMTLPPGEYVFAMADTGSSHHVVRVTDVTGRKVHSMVLTMPDYRLNATSKTVMYLGERPAGSPAAIKSWFYPGDTSGERFIYPKARAQALAAEANQPVPSREAEGPIKADESVHVQTPQKTEVAYNARVFEPTDAKDTAGVDGEPVQVSQVASAAPAGGAPRAELPKTASSLYTVGLAGLLLVGVGLALRASGYLRARG
jgi:hypothetical protein